MKYFETIILEDVDRFFSELENKTVEKIFYNIDLAEQTNNPKLFKKLDDEIWEFRTKHNKLQVRLLAFWDKTLKIETLVIATHGFIKKISKISQKEIEKTISIRARYFENKKTKK